MYACFQDAWRQIDKGSQADGLQTTFSRSTQSRALGCPLKGRKYAEAWEAFERGDNNAQEFDHLRYLNRNCDGAPNSFVRDES